MTLLGIEASSNIFSISLVKDKKELAYQKSHKPFSASESCALFVQAILEETDIQVEEIDRIAINIGPGSFTGLRVAHSFAIGFSQVTNIPIIGVGAFDLLFYKRKYPIIAIIESKQDEVYFADSSTEIQLVKKSQLRNFINSDSIIVTNKNFGLDQFSSRKIITLELSAKTLCLIAEKKDVRKNPPEILYFHHFDRK